MEIADLATVGGLATATSVVVAALKPMLQTRGRATHAVALFVACALAAGTALAGGFGTPPDWARAALTALLATASAIGLHQATVGVKPSVIQMEER